MTNVLINIPDLKKEDGGVYQYSVALLKILAKGNLAHHFFVLCNNPDQDIKEIVGGSSNFNFTKSKSPVYSKFKLFRIKWFNFFCRRLGLKNEIETLDFYDSLLSEHNIQIIHTPTQSLIIKPNVKSITTLHDVQELHYPEFFTSAQRAERAVLFKRAIDGADAVVVSYNHVKNDIIKYFDKPENKTHVVLLDMQDLWFSRLKNRAQNVLDQFQLPTQFILYPASTWEHKNHINLIKALKHLNNPEIHLICTGHQTEFFTKQVQPIIEENDLVDKIKFLGIVSDEELYELYNACKAVVVPTLYEAGSFPLMESILIGVPVICSNVTSLPETIGDDRFVFDPNSIDDIGDKIDSIWNDDQFRKENLALLKIQAEKLINNEAASKINKVYEEILSK